MADLMPIQVNLSRQIRNQNGIKDQSIKFWLPGWIKEPVDDC